MAYNLSPNVSSNNFLLNINNITDSLSAIIVLPLVELKYKACRPKYSYFPSFLK